MGSLVLITCYKAERLVELRKLANTNILKVYADVNQIRLLAQLVATRRPRRVGTKKLGADEASTEVPPDSSHDESHSEAEGHRKERGERRPFDAAGFLVDGVNGGATGIMQQAE
jgi:hypothetical protein